MLHLSADLAFLCRRSQVSSRALLARRALSTKVFYDSQSGQTIRLESTVCIHDLSFRKASTVKAKKDEFEETVRAVLLHAPSTLQMHRSNIQLLSNLQMAPKPVISTNASSVEDVRELKERDELGAFSGIVVDANKLNKDQVTKVCQEARSAGLHIRVNLGVDLSREGADEVMSACVKIGNVADAGAHVIALYSARAGHADDEEAAAEDVDEETLRLVVEEAFNLDVDGSPISSRMGFINLGQANGLENATALLDIVLKLGVKHIFSDSNSQGLSIGAVCKLIDH